MTAPLRRGRRARVGRGAVGPGAARGQGAAGRRRRAHLGLQGGQLGVDLAGLGGGVELLLDVVLAAAEGVGEGAGVEELVDGAGPGLHLGDLVLGPVEGHAGVGHRLGDARDGFADAGLGLGGGVAGLQGLLLGPEGVDLGLEAGGGGLELLLLGLDLLVLGAEALELVGQGGPAGQGLAGQVLLALGRAPAWPGPGALVAWPWSSVAWSSRRFLAVATSARARRTFWRFSCCFS